MYNLQKLKDTNWNNPKEVTAQEIAEYIFSLINKEMEEKNNRIEVKAPSFVIQKFNECSKNRQKQIHSAIQALNIGKVKYAIKKIQSQINEGYDSPLTGGEEENSTVKSLRAIFKHNNISEQFTNYFLPPANDITKWNRKKQISKVGEARIIARYLYEAEKIKTILTKNREEITRMTNQQKRNQTEHITITQWNQALKEQITQELTVIGTPPFKAIRIASKCTSAIKQIISEK